MSGPAAAPAAPDAIVELCAFRVGEEEYVLDLRRIREILQPLPITPVPRAPDFIEGVVGLRGEVVPIIDVRKRLGIVPRPGARGKILLVDVAGRALGLVVDGVVEVVRIPRSAIGPAPLLASGPRLFLGVCGARDAGAAVTSRGRPAARRIRLLLNVKALLEPDAPVTAAAARQRPGAPAP